MISIIRDYSAYFENAAGENYLIYTSRYPRDAISVTNEYVAGTNETVRVYAVGGDGILYDCLNGIVNLPNAQLAAIPYGTANNFVRSFGEEKNQIFRDIAKQANASVISTDVINIGSKYALNFCSVGLEPAIFLKYYEVSKKYPLLSQKIGKYLEIALAPFALLDEKVTHQKYELYIDGMLCAGKYLGIGFANGPCNAINNVPFPMAHPADGLLEVLTLRYYISPYLFIIAQKYAKGAYYKYPNEFKHVSAKEISINSEMPMHVNADGEIYYDTKVRAKIIPNAINFVAPDGLSYIRRLEKHGK